jgi:ADP-heptose:LPS heptosyltransferase
MVLQSKRWPPERFAAVADRLAARGLKAVAAWGPTDRDAAEAMLGATRVPVIAIGERVGLSALGALQRRARLYLANDSGPSHMAVAVGTPTVMVYGPSDERRYGPFGWRDDGSPIGLAVANPTLGADDPGPAFSTRRVDAVDVEQVWSAVERLL